MGVKILPYIHRYIQDSVSSDLDRKMVFIGGPRQSGKTTLAIRLCNEKGFNTREWYLNWDAPEDRENIIAERFPAGSGFLVLDEIHKCSKWRRIVKGLYDKRNDELEILVTGSARLDYYRKGGDSLQGRYFFYRLLPLTCAELEAPVLSTVESLMEYGGFPEPFRLQSAKESRRWSREYRSRIIRDDLADLENVKDLGLVEELAIRLPDLAGSPLSINALREDLQVAHQTVSRWIGMLENLYMIFRIPPFGAPKIRAVKKEMKHYHLDWTVVKNRSARFENLVACHLLKWCFFMQDTEGRDVELRFFRDVDRREVDFVITEDGKPIHLVECKSSSKTVNPSLLYMKRRFPDARATQVSLEAGRDMLTKEGIRLCPAHLLLSELV